MSIIYRYNKKGAFALSPLATYSRVVLEQGFGTLLFLLFQQILNLPINRGKISLC
nr:MAG TPA: hypothetical protein [Caudoviricetes sp.]